MRTWSLADVFDVFKKVEQLTRPPRRANHDADERVSDECRAPAPADCLSCGKRCTWPAGAAEQRPDCSCGLGDGVKLREHWSSCAVWDDDQVAKLADMEAEMDRQVGESADRTDYLGPYHVPDPFPEPALTDDELVAVRGLIQERYEPGYHPHQAIPDHNGYCKAGIGGGELCDLHETNAIHTDSPAASAPGDSGEAVSPIPLVPASPRSDLSANQQAKRAAEIIDRHFPDSSELSYIKCGCRFECDRVSTWARHVAAELHPQT